MLGIKKCGMDFCPNNIFEMVYNYIGYLAYITLTDGGKYTVLLWFLKENVDLRSHAEWIKMYNDRTPIRYS